MHTQDESSGKAKRKKKSEGCRANKRHQNSDGARGSKNRVHAQQSGVTLLNIQTLDWDSRKENA